MALKKAQVTDTTTNQAKAAETAKAQETAVAETQVNDAATVTGEVIEHQANEPAADPVVVETQTAAEPQATDAQEAQAEPARAEEPSVQEVAVRTEGAVAVATSEGERQRGAMKQYISQELANEGFEDLELTGLSFDRIKLHEGKFKLGTEEFDLGEEFDCIIHSTRGIYVVRQSTDEDSPVYYSYDPEGKTLSDGTSAETILDEWRDDGYATEENPVDIKKYLEVMVTLVNREDEYEDTMASLSIPPASRDRLAGAAAMAKQKYKVNPSGVITKCKVGKKVGEGKKAFRPWVFQVVGLVG